MLFIEFTIQSMQLLKNIFRHCYHFEMDAIIPENKIFAVIFFSPRIGEVFVSQDIKEIIYYNFKLRTKL